MLFLNTIISVLILTIIFYTQGLNLTARIIQEEKAEKNDKNDSSNDKDDSDCAVGDNDNKESNIKTIESQSENIINKNNDKNKNKSNNIMVQSPMSYLQNTGTGTGVVRSTVYVQLYNIPVNSKIHIR